MKMVSLVDSPAKNTRMSVCRQANNVAIDCLLLGAYLGDANAMRAHVLVEIVHHGSCSTTIQLGQCKQYDLATLAT